MVQKAAVVDPEGPEFLWNNCFAAADAAACPVSDESSSTRRPMVSHPIPANLLRVVENLKAWPSVVNANVLLLLLSFLE